MPCEQPTNYIRTRKLTKTMPGAGVEHESVLAFAFVAAVRVDAAAVVARVHLLCDQRERT